MLIGNIPKLTFTVLEGATDFTITLFDADTELEVGVLNIKIENGVSFLNALSAIYREVRGPFSEFDQNNTANTYLQNNAGTIEFNE